MPHPSPLYPCPLCRQRTDLFMQDRRRPYYRCRQCGLVHVPQKWHLSAEAEKQEYDRHDNNPEDPGYRRFLSRMLEPMLKHLQTPGQGLEFGCGPGPALAQMFEEAGHCMTLYDYFYFPNRSVFSRQFDFISATEVVEHLADPAAELRKVWDCLKPGGCLGIMTKRVLSVEAFASWHYKNDPTHISFFAETTFEFLAEKWSARLEVCGPDTVIFHKLQSSGFH